MLGRIYVERVQRWRGFLELRDHDEGGALDDIEQSLLAIKVLRRLLISGYEFPNRHKEVQEFWTIISAQFDDLLRIAMQAPLSVSTQVQTLIGKHLLQFSKLHLDMARTHPAAFALLPDAVALARAYWSLVLELGEAFGSKSAMAAGTKADDGKPLMEQLCLKGLLLLRACAKMVFSPANTFKYQHVEEKDERKKVSQLLKTQLLTEELAREMMETLVTRYFVLRSTDLQEWEEEPQEWERREEGEGDAWEYSIRSCCEKLFLDLVINFKHLLLQRLIDVFHSISCELTYFAGVRNANFVKHRRTPMYFSKIPSTLQLASLLQSSKNG